MIKKKPLSNLDIEGIYFSTMKAMHDKTTASIISLGEIMEAFPLKMQNHVSMATLAIIIQYSSGSIHESR